MRRAEGRGQRADTEVRVSEGGGRKAEDGGKRRNYDKRLAGLRRLRPIETIGAFGPEAPSGVPESTDEL